MRPDLPGFYFDAEKNRYFPIKGPIPGSSSSAAVSKPVSKCVQAQAPNLSRRTRQRISNLLYTRELDGNVISLNKSKRNFNEEFQKIQASQPMVWKYEGTKKLGDGALEQMQISVETPEGQKETDVLLTGGINGLLSLLEVGKVGQLFHNGMKCIPDRAWPLIKENNLQDNKAPRHIWRPPGASIQMSSSISCIKLPGKNFSTADDCTNIHRALITTLGSDRSGGSVFLLNLVGGLDFNQSIPIIRQRIHGAASFNCTIWTADCNSNASQAVIGTNVGAALVNLETGRASWVLRSRSDVLAQQFDRSGNVVLCGLRNGAIVTVDIRERRESLPGRFIRHRIPYSSLNNTGQRSNKEWFELKGNINPSQIIYMPSSISCLVSLQLYDQYFLASSMDGSIKLYDHRLTKRGAVQSYEGHVNSHTYIQLGVDQFERFIMSGGEDCCLRLWSIKSGQLLLEDKFSSSVSSTMCWPRSGRYLASQDEGQSCSQNCKCEAWLGSQEGLFNMQWDLS